MKTRPTPRIDAMIASQSEVDRICLEVEMATKRSDWRREQRVRRWSIIACAAGVIAILWALSVLVR